HWLKSGCPLAAALDEQPVLQRGHVEKCKAWRTRSVTDFPAVRHVLGIERWCSQRACLRRPRPQRHRQKIKARHLGLYTLSGGLPFSTAKARYAETRPQKSRHTSIALACRIGRPLRGREITMGTNRRFTPVRHPKTAAQESGIRGRRQSRWLRTADGFAVRHCA